MLKKETEKEMPKGLEVLPKKIETVLLEIKEAIGNIKHNVNPTIFGEPVKGTLGLSHFLTQPKLFSENGTPKLIYNKLAGNFGQSIEGLS